jgi:Protein of unknown function (DUF1236)
MRIFVHRFAVIAATAGWVAMAMPMAAMAQGANTMAQGANTTANPIPARPSVPPLQLSDMQRAQIRAALKQKHSEVSFALKKTKSAASFEPAVGAKLPKGVQSHPLPRPLIYQVPILKEYTYVKFRDQILIVNPLTKKVADLFPQS